MIPDSNASKLKSFFKSICDRDGAVSEKDLANVRELVHNVDSDWREKELTFAILTSVDFPTDRLKTDQLSDFLIPYSKEELRQKLQGNKGLVKKFLACQQQLISRLKCAPINKPGLSKHYCFLDGSGVFKSEGIIESREDGSRSVDRVVRVETTERFARKLLSKSKNSFEWVKNEIEIMRRTNHHHVVKLVESYTDASKFGLIILPIADRNLRSFLEDNKILPGAGRRYWIKSFFGCLAEALRFLHELGIHHQDIKPENILIRKGDGDDYFVMFCDFGISKDSAQEGQNTTYSLHQQGTDRYCAPELKQEGEAHNKKVDIFSLACVYVEMWTVIHSKSLHEMGSFVHAAGTNDWTYHSHLNRIEEWIKKIEDTEGYHCDIEPTQWIHKGVSTFRFSWLIWLVIQLKKKAYERPSAAELSEQILEFYYKNTSPSRTHYIGDCCVRAPPSSTSTGFVKDQWMQLSLLQSQVLFTLFCR